MALERGPIPLYYQLAWALRSQIHSRSHRPDARLPTETTLMRSFGVSRTTVRLAFQLLLKDGMVRRIPGRGTFVTGDPGRNPAQWMAGTIDEIITSAARLRYRYRLIGIRDTRASPELATIFGLPPGSPLTEIRRLRLVDGRPFFHVTIYLPRELATRIQRERLGKQAVVTLLEEHCGMRVVAADQWMSAALADSEVARHLKLEPGDPVLLIERHYLDERGRVVEVTVDRYRTDRVRYYLRLQRQATQPASGFSAVALPAVSDGRGPTAVSAGGLVQRGGAPRPVASAKDGGPSRERPRRRRAAAPRSR